MNNCPTCRYPMNDDNDFHWCPACGTLTTPDGSTHVPELAIQAASQKIWRNDYEIPFEE